MPHFYLHISDDKPGLDLEGGEYADFAAARRDAVIAAREIMIERLRADQEIDGSAIEICDADGVLLDTVVFRDILRLKPPAPRQSTDR